MRHGAVASRSEKTLQLSATQIWLPSRCRQRSCVENDDAREGASREQLHLAGAFADLAMSVDGDGVVGDRVLGPGVDAGDELIHRVGVAQVGGDDHAVGEDVEV